MSYVALADPCFAKEKIRANETLLHRMEFQHEVLTQQLGMVSGEREDLYSKFQHSIYEVQQKSGLKNLLLEKKIDTVEEALETAEAQVSELLTSANVDQAGRPRETMRAARRRTAKRRHYQGSPGSSGILCRPRAALITRHVLGRLRSPEPAACSPAA